MNKTIGLIAFILTLIQVQTATSAIEKKSERKPVNVEIGKAINSEFFQELKYISNIKPFRQVSAVSFIDGTISEKFVRNGKFVKKGQPLAAIKNINPGFNYTEHIIKAPISGVVKNFDAESGELVQKNRSVALVADVSKWRILVPMLQSDLGKLQEKDVKFLLRPKGSSDTLEAKIDLISPDVDEVLGTTIVEFALKSPKNKSSLRLGMITEVLVRYNRNDSLSVDERFIQKSSKGKYLFILNSDMTVSKKFLKTGIIQDGRMQILEGLTVDDKFVTKFSGRLRDGWKVKTAKNTNPSPST